MAKTKLSQTKRAKAMRALRRNETPEEKRARLDHRNILLSLWKIYSNNYMSRDGQNALKQSREESKRWKERKTK